MPRVQTSEGWPRTSLKLPATSRSEPGTGRSEMFEFGHCAEASQPRFYHGGQCPHQSAA